MKKLAGGLYSTFQERKPSRQTIGGFINDIKSTWENLSQEKIQNSIDLQPKIMEAIIAADGGHTHKLYEQWICFIKGFSELKFLRIHFKFSTISKKKQLETNIDYW